MRHQHLQSARRFRLPHEQPSNRRLRDAMNRVDVRFLCEHVYKLLKRDNNYFSPVRDDGQNPAFSIREDGEVGIDHGTGEGFNALKLIARIEGLTPVEARRRLIFYAEEGGVFPISDPSPSGSARMQAQPVPSWQRLPEAHAWHTLGRGEFDDYVRYAKLRGLEPTALMLAHAMGLFFFLGKKHLGTPYTCVFTDNARYVRQDRYTDGRPFQLKSRQHVKGRTLGAASWPVGAANIGDKPVVLLVEGSTDLLAAAQVILAESRLRDTVPVAMLGAGNHINVHALPHFGGKHVRIFPDRDEAGMKGAATWTEQLRGIAASIDCFSFDAFPLPTQKPIKDLNDFVRWGGTAVCKHIIPSLDVKGPL